MITGAEGGPTQSCLRLAVAKVGKDSYVAPLARTKEEEETDSYSIHVYYANETIKVTTKEKQ